VHHTIFPPVSEIRIDSETLLAAATPVGDGLWVLGPTDMVLHAAAHLFQENPAGHLRDLLDLHDLLTLFGQHAGFWENLIERAGRHGLGRPLYYGLRYAVDLAGTAIPAAVLNRAKALFAPNAVQLRDRGRVSRPGERGRTPALHAVRPQPLDQDAAGRSVGSFPGKDHPQDAREERDRYGVSAAAGLGLY
jgi:hypothetical protein